MIKLTLRPHTQPQELTYHHTMVIGAPSPSVDLAIEGLQAEHVRIDEHQGEFVLFNVANDPFVTVNDLPVWKKKLTKGDLISINNLTILFEGEPDISVAPLLGEDVEIPPPEPKQILIPPRFEQIDLPSWMREIEQVEAESKNQHMISNPVPEPEPTIQKTVEPNKTHTLILVRRLLTLVGSGLVILVFGIILLFFVFQERVVIEEHRAAREVADIAMALTSARLNHQTPPQQNGYDHEFLQHHLNSVLPDSYALACPVDAQGQFQDCPYLLRLYATQDLSRFLLIAQPRPSLLQWVVPKHAIVVDSAAMELRLMDDLRGLNRLVMNSPSLDDVEASEVSQLVHEGSLITPERLAINTGHTEFAPPRELSIVQPGAETKIHNLPRYYRLHEPLVRLALFIAERGADAASANLIAQELDRRSALPKHVFYIPQGIEAAIRAQQTLVRFNDGVEHPLLAYLTIHPTEQTIVNSHLLLIQPPEANEMQAIPPLLVAAVENKVEEEFEPPIDKSRLDPVFLKLETVANERKTALTPAADAVSQFLIQHTEAPIPEFSQQMQRLVADYERVHQEQNNLALQNINHLYQEYVAPGTHLSKEEFSEYLSDVGLEALFLSQWEKPSKRRRM